MRRLGLLLTFSLAQPVTAHNGAVALAVPAPELTIDGNLADWPANIHWNDITSFGVGTPPHDGNDLTARFASAFNVTSSTLYVAVEIVDESRIAEIEVGRLHDSWDSQDACELFIDLPHGVDVSPLIQYAVYGSARRAATLTTGELPSQTGVGHAMRREGTRITHEWSISTNRIVEGPQPIGPGMSVGFDVAVGDRDADGSFTWMAWGSGIAKFLSPERRGDLLLVDEAGGQGELHGTVGGGRPRRTVAGQRIRVRSLSSSRMWTTLASDREGRFHLPLPPGSYAVHSVADTTFEVTQVEPGRQTPVAVTIEAPQGQARVVSPAPRRAGPGDRSGRWHNFGTADGLPGSTVNSIGEDDDGNLWFGTRAGVSRYDGRTFTTFTTDDGLGHNAVSAILQDGHGYLWFGTDGGGVTRYDGQRLVTYTTRDGLAGDQVNAMAEDRDGNLWLGTWGGGLSRYDGTFFTTYTWKDGLANDTFGPGTVLVDGGGQLWVAPFRGGLSRYSREDGFGTIASHPSAIRGLFEDSEGRFWMVTEDHGAVCVDGDEVSVLTPDDGLASEWVNAIAEDGNGNLWFGTKSGGVSRYDGGQFTTGADLAGLPVLGATAFAEDVSGAVWIGSYRGLSRVEDGEVTVYTTVDGLPSNLVVDLMLGDDGRLWLATDGGGVGYWSAGVFGALSTEDGLGHSFVYAIDQDTGGDLWFATEGGLSRFDGRRFVTYTTDDGLKTNSIRELYADRRGRVWFNGGGVSVFDDGQLTTFTTADGLAHDEIRAIHEDRDGTMWFGTAAGLSRYDGTRFTTFTQADGLLSDGVSAIRQDRSGHLWFGSPAGVSRFDGTVFQPLLRRDGLLSTGEWDIFQDRDGDLWFGDSRSLSRYRQQPSPPPIRIVDVEADEHYGPVAGLHLSSSQDYVAFEFHGTSFKTRPEAMRYQYRLQGLDDGWRVTEEQRVSYHGLEVGSYTFEVRAIDLDLSYSTEAAVVALTIRPAYGQIGLATGLVASIAVALATSVQAVRRRRENDRVRTELFEATQEKNRVLEAANARLQEADELKSDFVASVSHELQTPLTIITSAVENMSDGIAGEVGAEQQVYLDVLRSSAARLSHQIGDLLDLSRIEAGHLRLTPSAVLIEEVAVNVIDSLKPFIDDKELTVELVRAVEAVPAWTDPQRVHQILMNLVNNAVKFTPRQGRVVVRVTAAEDAVTTTVEDTGPGIPAPELERVFEKFHQLSTTTTDARGAGIGLSIARRLVELQGGRIWAESSAEGSRFLFTLPRASETA